MFVSLAAYGIVPHTLNGVTFDFDGVSHSDANSNWSHNETHSTLIEWKFFFHVIKNWLKARLVLHTRELKEITEN